MNVIHRCEACGECFAVVPVIFRDVGALPSFVPDFKELKEAKVNPATAPLPLALCPPCATKKIDELGRAVAALQEGGEVDFA